MFNLKRKESTLKSIILNGEVSNYVIDADGTVYGKRGKLNPIKWGTQKDRNMYSFNHKGQKIRKLTARIVGEYCLDDVPPDLENWTINHKNGNTLDDSPSNLEWLSIDDNIKHAYDTGLSNGKCWRRIRAYNGNDFVGEYPSLWQCAKRLGLNPGNVHYAIKNNAEGKHCLIKGYYLVEVD